LNHTRISSSIELIPELSIVQVANIGRGGPNPGGACSRITRVVSASLPSTPRAGSADRADHGALPGPRRRSGQRRSPVGGVFAPTGPFTSARLGTGMRSRRPPSRSGTRAGRGRRNQLARILGLRTLRSASTRLGGTCNESKSTFGFRESTDPGLAAPQDPYDSTRGWPGTCLPLPPSARGPTTQEQVSSVPSDPRCPARSRCPFPVLHR